MVDGPLGLAEVLHQLQGCEIATGAWEKKVLATRVRRYESAWLDQLCVAGQMTWGRLAPRDSASAPSRAAPIAIVRRADLPWLLRQPVGQGQASGDASDTPADAGLSLVARDVLSFLRTHGASFTDEILAGTRRLRSEVEDALWELVGAGRVTGDSFAGLRGLLATTAKIGGQRQRWHARWSRSWNGGPSAGRWSLLRVVGEPPTEEERLDCLARQYVRRWGVVLREIVSREPGSPPWRDLLRVYRQLEMRGELRGGRLVAGLVGEQFAAPEALEMLRASRKKPSTGERVELSASDPLNLTGVLFPGPRIPAVSGQTVAYRDGNPELPDAGWTWSLGPPSSLPSEAQKEDGEARLG
jgi:ATP-dependent Lhr-like helicase